MANKYKDIRYKWLDEKGFNVLADEHQLAYVNSLFAPSNEITGVFCEAKSGTGKTTIAVLAGVYEVDNGVYDKIIYVRNAIPVRDQGFLPGDVNEKQAPYMRPLIKAMDKVQPGLFEFWSSSNPMRKEMPKVEAITTSFTRGDDWERAYVIVDESQSFDLEELQTIYTRCHDDCKVVTIGSLRQNDNRKIKRYGGLTPFEIFMKHYEGKPVAYHTLKTVYRGWWADHADDVQDTIDKLSKPQQEV